MTRALCIRSWGSGHIAKIHGPQIGARVSFPGTGTTAHLSKNAAARRNGKCPGLPGNLGRHTGSHRGANSFEFGPLNGRSSGLHKWLPHERRSPLRASTVRRGRRRRGLRATYKQTSVTSLDWPSRRYRPSTLLYPTS